jgi:hypothetical protein
MDFKEKNLKTAIQSLLLGDRESPIKMHIPITINGIQGFFTAFIVFSHETNIVYGAIIEALAEYYKKNKK